MAKTRANLVRDALASVTPAEVVRTTKALCSIPSSPGNEGPLALTIADMLRGYGIDVQVHPEHSDRPNVLATIRSGLRRGNSSLALQGHLYSMVVPGWADNPYEPVISRGRIVAGGITDMKAGLAAMIVAGRVAAQVKRLPTTVFLLFTIKDGRIGTGARELLASLSPVPKYGICAEGTSLVIHTAHGASVEFEVQVLGRPAHVTHIQDGIDALSAGVKIYTAVQNLTIRHRKDPRLPNLPRLVLDAFHSETWPATVPGDAVLRGNLRIPPGLTEESVLHALQSTVDRACPPNVRATVRLLASTPPFRTSGSGRLISAISAAHAMVRGTEPLVSSGPPLDAAATDAAELSAAGVPTVIYGPGTWRYVSRESVNISEIVDAAKTYVATALLL